MTEHAPLVRRPATYRDVLDALPDRVAELVDGTLHLQPRSRHARAAFELSGRLDDPFENGVGGPGGWWFAVAPELHVVEQVVVPDLAGFRRRQRPSERRRETMPGFFDVAAFEQVPDWVCEILSPSTRSFDLGAKRDVYARGRRPPVAP